MNVEVYCDGSGTLGDGPACIGVVVFVDGVAVCEVSEHVGPGTNNIAELRALRRAMWLVETMVGLEHEPAPRILTDSEYAMHSFLKREWKVKKNKDLIGAIRKQGDCFKKLALAHVRGHEGVYGNELADWLANEARVRFYAKEGVSKPRRRRPVHGDGTGTSPRC